MRPALEGKSSNINVPPGRSNRQRYAKGRASPVDRAGAKQVLDWWEITDNNRTRRRCVPVPLHPRLALLG